MGIIQVLDDNTINQIAAGEVIERPASVVKELVENAIDACASDITVEIKEGGISLIRITDNGCGIEKEDIPSAFMRHATSKIRTATDLLSVHSLGFRGEALSSVASVAMVELITKTKSALMGNRYEIQGGKAGEIEEVGVPSGTTFLVRNLFYNTPARKKFLKTAMTEAGYIHDVICHIAMSHPEIGIRFINNGKQVLNTSGNGNLKDVIYQIYGREIASNLLPLHYRDEENGMEIEGFLAKPVVSRGNRNFENYFINGRYIRSNLINRAIEDGYKNFMMQHKYPFTALHFHIAQEMLDVNVHPAKLELKLQNGEVLFPQIVEVVAKTLEHKDFIVEAIPGKEEKKETEPKKDSKKESTPEFFEQNRRKEAINLIPAGTKKEAPLRMPEAEKTIMPEAEKKIEKNRCGTENPVVASMKKEELKTEKKEVLQVAEEPPAYGKAEQMTLFEDHLLSKEARLKLRIVGQVFETYWIVEYGDKMFLIDQHAAHEKVLFESMMKKLKTKEIISQEIQPPIILNLSLREGELVRKYRDEFAAFGYEIEDFGGGDYAVHTVPYDLYHLARQDMLMELIDSLSEDMGIKRRSDLMLDSIATMSCKAAVKGNNKLSYAEAEQLFEELMTLENPYNCPHGRPTIISMSKYEIEKKFKRIV